MSALLLAGCSVKDQETEITVFHESLSSVYTGKVKRKIPEGEGKALLASGASVNGEFKEGTFISGEADQVPYQITLSNEGIKGIYTGEVAEEMPSGNGSFVSDTYSYEGSWNNGAPDGAGTVSASLFHINTPSEVLEGSYEGAVNNGLAEGNGTFAYQSGNEEIKMAGSFAGNMFDGLLVKTIRYQDTEKSYPVYYRKGVVSENAAAMIAYLEGMRNESYCLSEAQVSYISDHSDLFEGTKTNMDLSKETDSAFSYAGFTETSDPSLILISNAVVKSVQRSKPYTDSDTVTSMIVQNSDGWYHLVFAYSVDSADKGNVISCYALPLCRSTLTAPEQDYEAIDAAGAVVLGN